MTIGTSDGKRYEDEIAHLLDQEEGKGNRESIGTEARGSLGSAMEQFPRGVPSPRPDPRKGLELGPLGTESYMPTDMQFPTYDSTYARDPSGKSWTERIAPGGTGEGRLKGAIHPDSFTEGRDNNRLPYGRILGNELNPDEMNPRNINFDAGPGGSNLDRRQLPPLPIVPPVPSIAPHNPNPPGGGGYQIKPGEKLSGNDMLLIRHGATDYNLGSGAEKNKEYIRGHIDVPLNEDGRQQAADTANELATSGKIQPGDLIVSSDLTRAHETANAIAAKTGAHVMLDPNLRPWDLGDFQGKPVEDCKAKIEGYCLHSPDEPVPNGESFNQFKDRASDAMIRAAQMGARAIVTHHRLDRLDAAMDEKGDVDFKTFLSKGDETGSYRPIRLAEMDTRGKNIIDFAPRRGGESAGGGGSKGPAEVVQAPLSRNEQQLYNSLKGAGYTKRETELLVKKGYSGPEFERVKQKLDAEREEFFDKIKNSKTRGEFDQHIYNRAKELGEAENGKGSWAKIGEGGQEHYIRDARRDVYQTLGDTPSPKIKGDVYQIPEDPYLNAVQEQIMGRVREQGRRATEMPKSFQEGNVSYIQQDAGQLWDTNKKQMFMDRLREFMGKDRWEEFIKSNPVDITPIK